MAELIADCPRCGTAKITFHVRADNLVSDDTWDKAYEAFCVCRHCWRSTTFLLRLNNYNARFLFDQNSPATISDVTLNGFLNVEGFVSLADLRAAAPPEHLPEPLLAVFNEGARCLAVACFNAAGTMFRMCVDLATQPLLPAEEPPIGPNYKQRRDLGLRLPWLFDKGLLTQDLHELASCIKEDGNDGAHQGTLGKAEAEDLLDFTRALLERRYTQPERLRLAAERRSERRA